MPTTRGMKLNLPSRPAGARGLKLVPYNDAKRDSMVAPRRGAWIETAPLLNQTFVECGRAPQGRVD